MTHTAAQRARKRIRDRIRYMEKKAQASTPCPECGKPKFAAETLRVHRWIGHGVHELPKPEYPKAS